MLILALCNEEISLTIADVASAERLVASVCLHTNQLGKQADSESERRSPVVAAK